MTTETLQRAIKARPVRPFTLHLTDQTAIAVPHPEWIAHREGGRVAAVIQPDDSVEYIDLLLVVTLEVGAPSQASQA